MTQVERSRARHFGRWAALISVMASFAALAPAGTAGAAVTIGAPSLDVASDSAAAAGVTYSNSLIPGQQASSPVNGTITSWAFRADPAGAGVTLRVIRFVGNNSYLFVASSTPASVGSAGPHSFPASIPIAAGDRIALTLNAGGVGFLDAAGAVWEHWFGDPVPADGTARPPDGTSDGVVFLFNATIEPDPPGANGDVLANGVAVRSVARNRRHGTALLILGVPSAGQLTVSGGGAQIAGSLNRPFAAAGDTQLTVRASGKKRRKLNSTGKVRLNLSIGFMPTGGTARTDSLPVKLRKKIFG